MTQPRSAFITAVGDFIMALFPSYPVRVKKEEAKEKEEDENGTQSLKCPFCKQTLPLVRALRRDHYDNTCPAKRAERNKRKRSSSSSISPRGTSVKRQRRAVTEKEEYEVERISEHQYLGKRLLFRTHWKNAADGLSETWEPKESFVTLCKGAYVDVNKSFIAYLEQNSLTLSKMY